MEQGDGLADADRILIAIPLFRSPELIEPLFASLIAMADEIRTLPADLLLINDSPDDDGLRVALDLHLPALREAVDVELVANSHNLGFVGTANRAFTVGLERSADVLLLNSDARPRPGTFAEMAAVARLDPMIGFVSPRSDNATLCDSPYPSAWRAGSPDQTYANHKAIERFLPRYSYAPTAVGFCLLVRGLMIEEFGLFDEIYEGGYNEENDLIRRCNRRGYRAVLANHAYVHHLGGASFAASSVSSAAREERNRAILIERYPEYPLAVQRFYEGADHRAQRLLAGLVPLEPGGLLRVLFDCRTLECSHKGTFEHSRRLLAAIASQAADRFELFVLCEQAAFDFHALHRIDGLRFCEQEDVHDRPFAVAMRLVQPFLLEDIITLADYAPVTGCLVLDTIAMDCQQLDTHGLDTLWRFMAEAVSLIGYNSDFTRDQFRRRIEIWPHVTEFISRCSTAESDYAEVTDQPGQHVLVVGNDYPHKFVAEAVAAIRAADPDIAIRTLGVSALNDASRADAGTLDEAEVDRLYRDASIVVFPSHYEGFGLPILHGLARRKPVIARDLPSAREIAARVEHAWNLHLATSTAEMADMVARGLDWQVQASDAGGSSAESWDDAAQALLDAIETELQRFDFGTCRRQQAAIIGHRARLDAEHRYHEGASNTAELQARITEEAQRRIESHRKVAELSQEAAEAQLSAQHAETLALQARAEGERSDRAASQSRKDADAARWAASRATERAWAAERDLHRHQALQALLEDAPTYQTPVYTAGRGPRPMADRFFDWIAKPAVRGRLDGPRPVHAQHTAPRLDLTLSRPCDDPAELMAPLLSWIDVLPLGGRLDFIVDRTTVGEQDIRTLLHALGCMVTHVAPSRSLRMIAVKMWEARWPLSGSAEAERFLEAVYHIILHREPDEAGAQLYLAALASGTSRDDIVRSLLTSRERFEIVSRSLIAAGVLASN